MKVKELISILQKEDQELEVVHPLFSERCILNANDVGVVTACEKRPDGWVQNERPDMPTCEYLQIG